MFYEHFGKCSFTNSVMPSHYQLIVIYTVSPVVRLHSRCTPAALPLHSPVSAVVIVTPPLHVARVLALGHERHDLVVWRARLLLCRREHRLDVERGAHVVNGEWVLTCWIERCVATLAVAVAVVVVVVVAPVVVVDVGIADVSRADNKCLLLLLLVVVVVAAEVVDVALGFLNVAYVS